MFLDLPLRDEPPLTPPFGGEQDLPLRGEPPPRICSLQSKHNCVLLLGEDVFFPYGMNPHQEQLLFASSQAVLSSPFGEGNLSYN